MLKTFLHFFSLVSKQERRKPPRINPRPLSTVSGLAFFSAPVSSPNPYTHQPGLHSLRSALSPLSPVSSLRQSLHATVAGALSKPSLSTRLSLRSPLPGPRNTPPSLSLHTSLYFKALEDDLVDRDVRQMLRSLRKEILSGCKIVFSRLFPTKFQAKNHHLWKTAELVGATCSTEIDPSVTHVVSTDTTTEKSIPLDEKKFVVDPRWIEASNYLWKKQPEENYTVTQTKSRIHHDDPPLLERHTPRLSPPPRPPLPSQKQR